MKPYHILPCKHLKKIQEEVIRWIEKKNPLFFASESLWNKIDTVDLIKSAPFLQNYFQTLNLKIRECALTVITEYKDTELHIDELPVTAKINIPILNTKHSVNRWYEIPNWLLSSTSPISNKFGKKYYQFADVDYKKLNLLGEIELLEPIVFNSQLAHNIVLSKQSIFPRIVLATTFFKEPINYLKE